MVCSGAGTAVVTGILIALGWSNAVGGEELLHGELDLSEDLAGIILITLIGTLFARDTVIVGGNKQLGVPLQSDDGELA